MSHKNKYSILMKNLQMYNYLLEVKDERHADQVIIEAVPDFDQTMMIWLGDFNFPPEEQAELQKEIELDFKAKKIGCIFKMGKRIQD